jgi:ribosomal-protein-alanine N-acetyltransferase
VLPFHTSSLIIRRATQGDARHIKRLLDDSWAVHTRIATTSVQDKLDSCVAFLAEDAVSLRGFMMVEPQPPHSSLILTVGIHDNKKALPIIQALISAIEAELLADGLTSMTHIGEAPWLNRELSKFGFEQVDKIVTFDWRPIPLPQIRPHPKLTVRSARLEDIPYLIALDRLAFGPVWQKPKSAFQEAIRQAISFAVGIIDDEIVAYEWCDQYDERAHLTRLATHPDYQGEGIGTLLLHYTLQTMHNLNIKVVSLNTQVSNVRSQELYKRFGFKQTSEEAGVYWKVLQDPGA